MARIRLAKASAGLLLPALATVTLGGLHVGRRLRVIRTKL